MARPFGVAVSRPAALLRGKGAKPRPPDWLLPAALGAVSLFCLGLGADSLARHFREPVPRPYRAPSGVLLILAGALQMRVAAVAWRRRHKAAPLGLSPRSPFWRQLLVGAVACYAGALALGPDPFLRYAFRAAVALWYSITLALVVTPPAIFRERAFWRRWRLVLLAGRAAFLVALALVAAEGAARLYATAASDDVPASLTARRLALPPGRAFRGRLANTAGYWDDEFAATRPSARTRVAVLGDEFALSGCAETNFLARMERENPDWQIDNFALHGAGPREYRAALVDDVLRYRPDVVLAVISVGDDVTSRRGMRGTYDPGVYDLRGLTLVQLGMRCLGVASGASADPFGAAEDRKHYLHRAAERLEVCRAPMSDSTRRCWRAALECLDSIVEACRAAGIRAALVVAPAEHQVDDSLRKLLCRRRGYSSEEYDGQLPQRRLGAYASRRGVPMLDLAPHFRRQEAVFVRNDHRLNGRGNALAAKALSAWLRSHLNAKVARAN